MKKLFGCLSVLFLLLATFTSMSLAQSLVTGDLTGTVSDPSGAVVPNAQVALKNLQTGESQDAVTNAQGTYRFSLLKPGNYSVTATSAGFQAQTQNAAVNLGQVTTLNLKAGLAGTTTTVEVTTEAPLIQSDNANLSTTYTATQIDNLPAPGGDTTSYAYTTPGVTISTGGGYGGFSSYGLPSNSNLFTVNGNDNMDPYLNLNNSGASNLTLGANEVQEAAVVQNGYSVQYGRQAGAQENITTKSGSNQYHGNASYWYNAGGFNANDWFNNHTGTPRPHAVNNQYAASIGGHIIKDKLFFFADQEGLRYVLPSGGPVFVPSAPFESYVLSTLPAAQVPFYTNAFNLYNGAPGAARGTPVDTTAAGGLGGGCGDFDGTAGFGTGGVPCANQFQSTPNNINTEWLLSTRVDWNISGTDTLFGRFRTDHGLQATGTDLINPIFNAFSVQPEYEGQLNETHVFGSTATNQFIASGSWYQALFNNNNRAGALAAFPTTAAFNDGLFTALGGADNNYPQGRNVTQWQLIDDFSKTLGNHNLKFGANFRRNDVSSYATGPNTSGLLTVNSITDFATGSIGNGSTYAQNFRTIAQVPIALYSLAFYGQDQWKPTSNLSITAGIRFDRNANPKCVSHCFSRLDDTFLNAATASGAVAGGLPYNQSIQTGLSNAFPSIEAVVIQPRVGIAYSLRPTTVIRFGGGLFSDLFPGTLADRFITNAPSVTSFTTQTGTIDAPGTPGSIFDAVATANAAFQANFASGGSLGIPGTGPNFNAVAHKVANPKYLEYNVEVEQGIGNRVTASLNYVGNYGYDEFNQNLLENAQCRPNKAGTNCPFFGISTVAPDPRFNEIRDLNNKGYSNYNGFSPSLRFRASNYLQGSVSYTWSKAMDNCSNNCLLPFNALTAASIRNQISPIGVSTLNYGPADYDTTHSINANYVLSAPRRVFNNNLLSTALGGWTLAETVYFHSGYPFSVVNSGVRSNLRNVTGIASTVILGNYLGGGFDGCTSGAALSGAPYGQCLSPSNFAPTASQTGFGNLARNSFRGPHYFDTDVNLTKNFRLSERFTLGLGANAFNILNHPNFDLPVNNLASGSFGQIQSTVSAPTSPYGSFTGSAVSGRVLQLNAHVTF